MCGHLQRGEPRVLPVCVCVCVSERVSVDVKSASSGPSFTVFSAGSPLPHLHCHPRFPFLLFVVHFLWTCLRCATSCRCSETPVRTAAAGGCSRMEVAGSGSSACGRSPAVVGKPGGPCLELGRRRSSRSPRSPAYWLAAGTLRNQRTGCS